MMGLIDGKVALVTGAGTGIGREASILLAQEGATVVLTGRRIEPLNDVVAEIKKQGGKAVSRSLDIESRTAIFEAVDWVGANIGAIDILVNNAGSATKALNARFIGEEEWNSTVNLNLTAAFNRTHAGLAGLRAERAGTRP